MMPPPKRTGAGAQPASGAELANDGQLADGGELADGGAAPANGGANEKELAPAILACRRLLPSSDSQSKKAKHDVHATGETAVLLAGGGHAEADGVGGVPPDTQPIW